MLDPGALAGCRTVVISWPKSCPQRDSNGLRGGTCSRSAGVGRHSIGSGDRLGDVAAQAQEAPPDEAATEQPPTTAEQPVTAAEQPATGEVPAQTDLLAPEQLDILVSPVALYPDPLLVLVLPGSTFPVEVIAANRFLGKLAEQPELQPDPDWDTSTVGLLNYPDVLARMDAELDWTEALGEAVLNQLEDVQASIQQVRLQAYMAGMLATNEQQVVTGSPDSDHRSAGGPDADLRAELRPGGCARRGARAAGTGRSCRRGANRARDR